MVTTSNRPTSMARAPPSHGHDNQGQPGKPDQEPNELINEVARPRSATVSLPQAVRQDNVIVIDTTAPLQGASSLVLDGDAVTPAQRLQRSLTSAEVDCLLRTSPLRWRDACISA